MIEDPMSRIFERMDPGTSAMLEKYADPVLLAFGFMTWGIRVWAEMSMGRDDDEPRSGFDEPERSPGPDNGREVRQPAHEVVIIDGVGEPIGDVPVEVTDHINNMLPKSEFVPDA